MEQPTTKQTALPSHTPGPWEYDPRQTSPSAIGVVRMNGVLVCGIVRQTTHKDGEPAANAHLICAAPDLLAALERAIAASDEPGSDYDWIGEAVAAIAKARGTNA